MMKKMVFWLVGVVFCFSASSAHAVLLIFDDVPGGSIQDRFGNMPTYEGFNFSFTLDWIDLKETPHSWWNQGAHSGDFGILNNVGGTGIIVKENGDDFTFDGLWAKRWGTPKESGGTDSLFGVLEGYHNGSRVWSTNTGLNGSYEFYSAQSGAIDELRLGFGNYFIVDDITLNGNPAPVPEPASLVLMVSGLVGLALYGRKKAKATR